MPGSPSVHSSGDGKPRSGAREARSIDEIRERTSIVEIVAPHVSLKRAGRRLTGLCPFHPDKAPSFTVDPDKGLWHCFGCGAGGNVFGFLMQIENLTFPEAARKLAERLGVDLKGHREDSRARSLRDLLARINGEAASFFRRQLDDCALARDYLKGRGLSDEIVARFALGWAPPEWDALYKHLRRQGYHDADIEQSGLCVARKGGDGCYDRFRARVMFPILDAQERVVAFSGRVVEGAEAVGQQGGDTEQDQPAPKYINSSETPLFQKGRTLYAFPLARKPMGERGRAILVEGQFDVIACHAAGFAETVATLGTALTEDHVQVLRRHTGRVYAAYDSDSAGMKAVLRSQDLFEAAKLEVRVVRLPPGSDPDSFLAEHGPEALAQEIERAVTAMDYRLAAIAASHPDTDDGRLAMMGEVVEALAQLGDAVAQTHYIARLAERCYPGNRDRVRWMEQALHRELRKIPSRRRGSTGAAGVSATAESARSPRDGQGVGAAAVERQVLAAILQSEVAGRWLLKELSAHDFCDDIHRRVFDTIKTKTKDIGAPDVEALLAGEQEPDVCGLISGLALTEDGKAPDAELRKAVERLREWRDARRCQELLSKAGELGAAELNELTELRRRVSRLTGRRSIGEDSG